MQELIEIRDKNGIEGVIAFFDNEEQMKNLKNNINSYSNVLLDNNLIELAIEYDKKNGTQILMLLLEKYNKFFYDYKYDDYYNLEEGYYHTKAFIELFKYVKKLNTDEMNSILNTVFDYFKDKIPEEQYKYILAHTYNIDKNVIKYTMEKFDVKNNENLRLYLLNNILPKTIQCISDNKGTYDLSEHKTEKLIIQYVFETFEEDINKIITNTNKFYIYSILISDNDIFNYFINTCKDKTILKNLLSHALMFDKNINNILNLFYKLNININETLNNDNTTILMYACKNKNSNIVLALLNEYNNIDINAVDKYGKTALMYACENCTEEVIQALINKGAKVDTKNKNGLTALEILKIRNRTSYPEIKESILVEQQNNVSQKDNNFNEKQKVFLKTDYLETRKEHINRLTQLGADISFAYKLSKKPELRNRVIFYKNNNKDAYGNYAYFDKDHINPELKQLLEKNYRNLKILITKKKLDI